MNRSVATAGPSFTQPVRQIVLMLGVLFLVAGGAWIAAPVVESVFRANLYLNGFILGVFLVGVLACFWQLVQMAISVNWIRWMSRQGPGGEIAEPPSLLAPLAALLRSRGAQMQITTTSQRSILDSVGTRIDEARDITRYLTNLLVFLGLLRTFWGLATTVPAMVETIRNLTPQEGETGIEMFGKLMRGLESQLGGIGTAFSSWLLGLAGSLVIGLLELFAGHGQNRFYRELEEWTATITRFGFSAGDGEGAAGGDAGALAGVLDRLATELQTQSAANIAALKSADAGRVALEARISALTEAVQALAARGAGQAGEAEAQTVLLTRMVQNQQDLRTALAGPEGGLHADAENRMRLRSIDVQLLRILEELSAGRQESLADLRSDLAALTSAIRQLSRGQPPTARS